MRHAGKDFVAEPALPPIPLAATRQGHLPGGAGINRTYLSKLEEGASSPGLEIIAKLAPVPEIEPAELLRVPAPKGKGEDCC
jgi:hypothetical protein